MIIAAIHHPQPAPEKGAAQAQIADPICRKPMEVAVGCRKRARSIIPSDGRTEPPRCGSSCRRFSGVPSWPRSEPPQGPVPIAPRRYRQEPHPQGDRSGPSRKAPCRLTRLPTVSPARRPLARRASPPDRPRTQIPPLYLRRPNPPRRRCPRQDRSLPLRTRRCRRSRSSSKKIDPARPPMAAPADPPIAPPSALPISPQTILSVLFRGPKPETGRLLA